MAESMTGLKRTHRCAEPVSYTHLDVYKRQRVECAIMIKAAMADEN